MKKFAPVRTGRPEIDRVQDELARSLNPALASLAAMRPVAAKYSTASGQQLANATNVVVNYDTRDFDPDALVTIGDEWLYRAPSAGLYFVTASASVVIPGSTAFELLMDLRVNGDAVPGRGARITGTTPGSAYGGSVGTMLATLVQLNAGDGVSVTVFQRSAGTRALEASNTPNHVSIFRLPGS